MTTGEKHACPNCIHKKIKDQNKRGKKLISEIKSICKEKEYKILTNLDDTYENCRMDFSYECQIHGVQRTNISNFMITKNCPKCSLENAKFHRHSKEDVKKLIESKNNNIWINEDEYVNALTNNLLVKCGTCGKIFSTSYALYKRKLTGACIECTYKTIPGQRYTKEQVNEIIESVNGNIWLNPNDYINNGVSNLKILCGKCGSNIFTTSLGSYQNKHKTICGVCANSISILERVAMNFFDNHNIEYEFQKKFSDCKDKKEMPFDFYLPEYNTCVELDGQGHYDIVWDEESYMRCILHDAMKTNYCRWNNINLIRIPYWDIQHIEKILSTQLNISFENQVKNKIA